MHCWHGDNVVGFEQKTGTSGGGIQATGNHPGRARTPDELRADLEFSYSMIPGKHRLKLHAMYMDTCETPDRDEIEYKHFESWVDWAQEKKIGIDFNPTFFAHEKADDNLTLSRPDTDIRDFWIEHGRRASDIAFKMGSELGSTFINNIWIPDGYKDYPIDRISSRQRLESSLDEVIAQQYDRAKMRDAVECKLFGIGVEAMTVGSHEFYLGYATRKDTVLSLVMVHFHPTENIADKLSSVALSVEKLLLHVSRPMRWDSDQFILQSDEILMMAQELVASDLLARTYIGLDFFDATISGTAAWVIGTRNMQKALLRALLLPISDLKSAEHNLNLTSRFIMTEEAKDLPFGIIWNEFCSSMGTSTGLGLIKELDLYQTKVPERG